MFRHATNGDVHPIVGQVSRKQICPSDRRVKENIERIGDHPLGFGLYLFDYKPDFRDEFGRSRQFGVMADEVAKVLPEAVVQHPRGFQMVNYQTLGIRRFIN